LQFEHVTLFVGAGNVLPHERQKRAVRAFCVLHFGQIDVFPIAAGSAIATGLALATFNFLRVLKYRIEKVARSAAATITRAIATTVSG
jgi:hypothetical protein